MDTSRAAGERSSDRILNALPDAVLICDEDGRIVRANGRVADVLGYGPDELRGELVERLVPEDVREAHVARREGYVDDPEARPMAAGRDLRARRSDGSTVPVDVALSPVEIDGEQHVITVVRDVSEREALRTKHRAILDAMPDAVVVAETASGEIVEASERVADLLGYDPADLVGRDQSVLHPSGEEDRYRALFEQHVAAGRTIFTGFPDGGDVHVETSDGERIPVEINARVFELDGRQLIAGGFRDVSNRKERERRLEALHETTRRLMEASDRDEIARLVADAANAILGFSSNVVRLVGDDRRLRPVAVSEQAQADLGPRPDYPLDGDNPASRAYDRGEPVLYDDVGDLDDGYDRGGARSAVYLPLGEHGVISVVDAESGAFDRTDVDLASILATNAETALDRLAYERDLERQNDRLEEFSKVVSHDLRNPLNVAHGWLDLVPEEEAPEHLDRVEDALDRMDEIIEDTLTLAQEGDVITETEAVAITHLAGECWRMIETGDARLEVDDEFDLWGDRDRLQHVFENLFRNAIDHGGPDVTIRIGALDDGFYVEDDGPGIPEGEREAVFEPGHTSSATGTGFGLAIVGRIAEAHGWDVRVTDGSDGGARFEFEGVEFA